MVPEVSATTAAFRPRLKRSDLILNIGILLAGLAIAVLGGAIMATGSHPVVGVLFFTVMTIGAWTQVRAIRSQLGKGLWQGLCPHCGVDITLGGRRMEAKDFRCPVCRRPLRLADGTFSKMPWYAA